MLEMKLKTKWGWRTPPCFVKKLSRLDRVSDFLAFSSHRNDWFPPVREAERAVLAAHERPLDLLGAPEPAAAQVQHLAHRTVPQRRRLLHAHGEQHVRHQVAVVRLAQGRGGGSGNLEGRERVRNNRGKN